MNMGSGAYRGGYVSPRARSAKEQAEANAEERARKKIAKKMQEVHEQQIEVAKQALVDLFPSQMERDFAIQALRERLSDGYDGPFAAYRREMAQTDPRVPDLRHVSGAAGREPEVTGCTMLGIEEMCGEIVFNGPYSEKQEGSLHSSTVHMIHTPASFVFWLASRLGDPAEVLERGAREYAIREKALDQIAAVVADDPGLEKFIVAVKAEERAKVDEQAAVAERKQARERLAQIEEEAAKLRAQIE